MDQPAFARRVQPLPPSAISYLRTRLRCGLGQALASPCIAPAQGLLLFSLTYGAGASVEELAKLRVCSLLDENGRPASQVHFDPTVTKHRSSRRVAMHPDVASDLDAFLHFFPAEQWVAFRPEHARSRVRPHLPASTITSWFRSCLREAGLGQFSIASGRKTFLFNQRSASS